MKKDKHQKIAYALRRLSVAVDRIILAKTLEEKKRAQAWAGAWSVVGKLNHMPGS